jgi:hypothetical protein
MAPECSYSVQGKFDLWILCRTETGEKTGSLSFCGTETEEKLHRLQAWYRGRSRLEKQTNFLAKE